MCITTTNSFEALDPFKRLLDYFEIERIFCPRKLFSGSNSSPEKSLQKIARFFCKIGPATGVRLDELNGSKAYHEIGPNQEARASHHRRGVWRRLVLAGFEVVVGGRGGCARTGCCLTAILVRHVRLHAQHYMYSDCVRVYMRACVVSGWCVVGVPVVMHVWSAESGEASRCGGHMMCVCVFSVFALEHRPLSNRRPSTKFAQTLQNSCVLHLCGVCTTKAVHSGGGLEAAARPPDEDHCPETQKRG